jgi:hypothetical protein
LSVSSVKSFWIASLAPSPLACKRRLNVGAPNVVFGLKTIDVLVEHPERLHGHLPGLAVAKPVERNHAGENEAEVDGLDYPAVGGFTPASSAAASVTSSVPLF